MGPVLEIARIRVVPGGAAGFEAALSRAAPLLAASPGCLGATLFRAHETPGEYRLLVRWRSLADHVDGFQASPAFAEWRRLLRPFFDGLPEVEHLVEGRVLAPVAAEAPERS